MARVTGKSNNGFVLFLPATSARMRSLTTSVSPLVSGRMTKNSSPPYWTERRVRGHITVCFLAFTLRQILKQRLAEQSFAGSFVELVEGLSRVRAVLLDDGNGHRYRLRDEISAGAMPAFQALKIVPPRRVERLD